MKEEEDSPFKFGKIVHGERFSNPSIERTGLKTGEQNQRRASQVNTQNFLFRGLFNFSYLCLEFV